MIKKYTFLDERGVLFDLPKGEVKIIDNLHVQQPCSSYFVFREYPFFVEVLRTGWVDVKNHKYSLLLTRNFGTYRDYEDITAGASVHVVKNDVIKLQHEIGFSFYGIVSFLDCATFSDIIKKKRTIKTIDGIMRKNLGYYFSWPLEGIEQIESIESLVRICKNETLSSRKKSKELLALF